MKQPFGQIDTLSISGELKVPLVILLKQNLTQKSYIGFIPGLSKKDIKESTLENCKKKLKLLAESTIKEMATNNLPFPFFPSKEEILTDFENVCYISFIKIKSQKRKS